MKPAQHVWWLVTVCHTVEILDPSRVSGVVYELCTLCNHFHDFICVEKHRKAAICVVGAISGSSVST